MHINDVISIDTETTTWKVEEAKLTQVAAVQCGEITKHARRKTFTAYVNPGDEQLRAMQPDVISVTRITPNFLAKHGEDTKVVLKRLIEKVSVEGTVVCAHNWSFDRQVLDAACYEHGIDFSFASLPAIDTLRLIQEHYEVGEWKPGGKFLPDMKLGTCFYGILPPDRWEIQGSGPHEATYDATMVCLIVEYFFENGFSVEEMVQTSSRVFVPKKMPFGKWKNYFWSDIPTDYLSWLVEKSDALEKDEGLQIAVIGELESRGFVLD